MGNEIEPDLPTEDPSSRADPTFARISSETRFKGPGFEFRNSSNSPAQGPGAVALSILMLSVAGVLAVGAIVVLAVATGAPAWLVLALAAADLLLIQIGGYLMIARLARINRISDPDKEDRGRDEPSGGPLSSSASDPTPIEPE